jgi:hypothetical protein
MCEITNNVKLLMDEKFLGYEKLMNEKFKHVEAIMEEKFKRTEIVMEEKFKTSQEKMSSDFRVLSTKLDRMMTQDEKINCVEKEMITKNFAYKVSALTISIVAVIVALFKFLI